MIVVCEGCSVFHSILYYEMLFFCHCNKHLDVCMYYSVCMYVCMDINVCDESFIYPEEEI